MFATITNVQKESCQLQKSIDNCCGKCKVGLKSITFTVGRKNVGDGEGFGYGKDRRQENVKLPTGLWSSIGLHNFIESKLAGVAELKVSKFTGFATFIVKPRNQVTISPYLAGLLGFKKTYSDNRGWFSPGEHIGDEPVDLVFTKTLGVYLNQINTSYNTLDGAPSTLLKTVQASDCFYGETVTLHFQHPDMKFLASGHIHELEISILDDRAKKLNNYYPISVVLEITD